MKLAYLMQHRRNYEANSDEGSGSKAEMRKKKKCKRESLVY